MRRHFYLLLILGLSLILFSQNILATETKDYELYGMIDKTFKVHMNLQVNNSRVTGTYYYDKYKKDIHLKGIISFDGNVLLQEHTPDDEVTGTFTGKVYFNRFIIGVWKNPSGNRQYPFFLDQLPSMVTKKKGKDYLYSLQSQSLYQPEYLPIGQIPESYSFITYTPIPNLNVTEIAQIDYQTQKIDYLRIKKFVADSVRITNEGVVIFEGKDLKNSNPKTYKLPSLNEHSSILSYLSRARKDYFRPYLPEKKSTTPKKKDEYPVYQVSTVEEFFQAIGSNRIIELAPGSYILSDFLPRNSKHVKFNVERDDHEWEIHDVHNLTIRNDGKEMVELLIRSAEFAVLKFVNSSSIQLEGIFAGHTLPSGCEGPVFTFKSSKQITILDSLLFGSGIYGFELDFVDDFLIKDSAITDCTNGSVLIHGGFNITFDNVVIKDNAPDLFIMDGMNIRFVNSQIYDTKFMFVSMEYETVIFENSLLVNSSEGLDPYNGVDLINTEVR